MDVAVRKQFGGPFNDFGGLRRQRNELEYSTLGTEVFRDDDAEDAIAQAGELIDTAEQMLPHLGFFRSGQ